MEKETKQGIYDAYVRGDKVVDISAKYGISTSYVKKIAVSMGATPRQKSHARETGNKVCPKCRKRIGVNGARFCPFCGTDIRSAKDILIERIDKARECLSMLPEAARDEVCKLFVDISAELNK
jgi:tRNA(Ile2) C34 agmatinyltransferase TiaS